jgi:RhtB (resistance to homoserine/threonine) family protein
MLTNGDTHMDLKELMAVTLVGLLAIISPGPDFIIVTRNSLLHSKRVGIATALGIATGNIFWIAASLTGISYAVSKAVILFNIIKWLGAAYLIYIGIQALASKKMPQESLHSANDNTILKLSIRRAYYSGLLTNLLNPKCALFFVSFFSVVVSPSTTTLTKLAYGLEISLMAVIWFSLIATVLSVEKVRVGFQRFSTIIDRTTGAILIVLGIKLAVTESK